MMIHHDPSISVHVEHTLNDHQIANHFGFITAWHSRCHGCHDTRHTSGPSRSSRLARDGERSAHWSSKIPGTASAGARTPQIQMLHLGDCGMSILYVTNCDKSWSVWLTNNELGYVDIFGGSKARQFGCKTAPKQHVHVPCSTHSQRSYSIVWKEKSSMIYPKRIISNGVTLRTPRLRPELSQVVKLHSQIHLPVNASPQTKQFHQQRPHGWDQWTGAAPSWREGSDKWPIFSSVSCLRVLKQPMPSGQLPSVS